ncbi:hypothetical protein NU688_20110 [Variovorax sp. ZS18.2.2]|uniref:COG4280 domain-containing protein n=1 Tax=Variovorax sp. ZS18.2.2 TaxID=2971255 RepID=UPI002150AF8C|nr:hypothetical protein [Variovorax sp. ZS18.2.2]MCR6478476.1 hypothetical protein [Variovorax sp. ZS18.2.2]
MIVWTSAAPSMLASFMASTVEFVEALTIVLAVGVVRGWRSALLGTAAALAVLVGLVAVLGPSLTRISLPMVQLVVGTLLLLFGLRWLRKAILRSAGVLALHDEAKAFAEETAALRAQGGQGGVARQVIDKLAFATAFKIVMLEGIEVVFIVVAIGASGQMMVPASIGALLALLAVVLLGLWLHRPLARVPENALKFGVGVMLAAFGTFWVGEGIGLEWPGADLAILALIGVYLVAALGLVQACIQLRKASVAVSKAPGKAASTAGAKPGVLAVIGGELFGLFFDDGWLAAGIMVWVLAAWFSETRHAVSGPVDGVLFAVGLTVVLAASAARRARAR